jgi:peptidoglycan/xylan/chitin deacetylase (PgdA/CDA1 family)
MPSAAVFKTSLDILYYSGTSTALRRVFGGTGAIIMLHHVLPGGGLHTGFAPNKGLEVTPEFLDQVITMLVARGFDLVNLDEAAARIRYGGRPFAAFTLDDGYRDNLVHARPVFQRHRCPYAIYVAPAITDGTCELWWRGLEAVIAQNQEVMAVIGGETLVLPSAGVSEKNQAWAKLYWPVRNLEQHEQRRWISVFCKANRVDLGQICREAAMTWDEVRSIAADPLCTIGAHTIHHYNVKALGAHEAFDEMVKSAGRIEQELGKRPVHFAYPYGDETSAGPRDFDLARKAGFTTAVTTRKGMIFPAHKDYLTALPRFSLAGEYQNLRYVRTLLSGVPFALFNGLKTLNVS